MQHVQVFNKLGNLKSLPQILCTGIMLFFNRFSKSQLKIGLNILQYSNARLLLQLRPILNICGIVWVYGTRAIHTRNMEFAINQVLDGNLIQNHKIRLSSSNYTIHHYISLHKYSPFPPTAQVSKIVY